MLPVGAKQMLLLLLDLGEGECSLEDLETIYVKQSVYGVDILPFFFFRSNSHGMTMGEKLTYCDRNLRVSMDGFNN